MRSRTPGILALLFGLLLPHLVAPPEASAAGKTALLVGVNAYPFINPLHGCVSDARSIRGILTQRFGFPEDRISMLTDSAATRQGILNALTALAQQSDAGDVVVVYYSGHGTCFPDDKSEEQDETAVLPAGEGRPEGRYDSAICPFDTGGPSASGKPWQNLILDDEIFGFLSKIASRGATVVLLSDSCHSGTLGRDVTWDLPRARAKYVTPEEALGMPLSQVPKPASSRSVPNRDFAGAYVSITACKDEQTSLECDIEPGKPGGLFTSTFVKILDQALAKPPSYRKVFDVVYPEVSRISREVYKDRQDPQLDLRFYRGSGDDLLFQPAPQAVPSPTPTPTATPQTEGLRLVARVMDTDGHPLAGASFCVFAPGANPRLSTIRREDTLILGRTNDKGLFDSETMRSGLRPGRYFMKVTREGYTTFLGEVDVREGQKPGFAVVSIRMAPE